MAAMISADCEFCGKVIQGQSYSLAWHQQNACWENPHRMWGKDEIARRNRAPRARAVHKAICQSRKNGMWGGESYTKEMRLARLSFDAPRRNALRLRHVLWLLRGQRSSSLTLTIDGRTGRPIDTRTAVGAVGQSAETPT